MIQKPVNKTIEELFHTTAMPIIITDAELASIVYKAADNLKVGHLDISAGQPAENHKTALRIIRLQQVIHEKQMTEVSCSVGQFMKAMMDLRTDWRSLKYHKKYSEIVIGLSL